MCMWPPHWDLHPLHSFPHEASKHRHDHFGVHFNQIFWKSIHSGANFSGHRDGISKREERGRMRGVWATQYEGDPSGPYSLSSHIRHTMYHTPHTISQILCRTHSWDTWSPSWHPPIFVGKSWPNKASDSYQTCCLDSRWLQMYYLSLETPWALATFDAFTMRILLGCRAAENIIELNKNVCWERLADSICPAEIFLQGSKMGRCIGHTSTSHISFIPCSIPVFAHIGMYLFMLL